MNKQKLAKQYADKKLSETPRNVYKKLPLGMEKSETNFDGYDIEHAYEDGFNKAVELARDYLEEIFGEYCNKNNVIEVFLKTMEERV